MCPVCDEPLVSYELEGVEIDRCLKCGGTWLDAGELEMLASLSGAPRGGLTAALAERGGEKHGARRCVRCASKLRIAAIRSVEVDHCPWGHGLWLDRGEMEKLIVASGDGGPPDAARGEESAVARFLGDLCASDLKGKQEKGE